jgi:hypothetical protein
MKSKKKLVFVLLAVAAGIAGYRFIQGRAAKENGAIRVSGNIEVTDVEVASRSPAGWRCDRFLKAKLSGRAT